MNRRDRRALNNPSAHSRSRVAKAQSRLRRRIESEKGSLEQMTIPQLRDLAQHRHSLTIPSKTKKAQIVETLASLRAWGK